MKIEEFEDRLKDLNNAVDEKTNQMEEIVKDYIEAVKIFSTEWTRTTVNDCVVSNFEVTNKLGKEGLSELKSSWGDLQEKFPQKIEKELNNDVYWKHRILLKTPKDKISFDDHIWSHESLDFRKNIDKLLGRISVYVGKLLLKYGYYNNSKDCYPWIKSGDGLRYASGIERTPEMKRIEKNYIDSYKEFNELLWELESLKTKRAQAEAKKLWDEV